MAHRFYATSTPDQAERLTREATLFLVSSPTDRIMEPMHYEQKVEYLRAVYHLMGFTLKKHESILFSRALVNSHEHLHKMNLNMSGMVAQIHALQQENQMLRQGLHAAAPPPPPVPPPPSAPLLLPEAVPAAPPAKRRKTKLDYRALSSSGAKTPRAAR